MNLYFPNIVDRFDPMPGIDTDKEICCFGCFSEDRKWLTYWFDRLHSFKKRVFIIRPNDCREAGLRHIENCIREQRTWRKNTINLSLSRLEGDSARYLAIREVYANLKRILEEHLLIESDYIICEYVNIIKKSFPETSNDNCISDIYMHFTEKLKKDSILQNGQRCKISAYNNIRVDTVLNKLQQLKSHNFDLKSFPLPVKDQNPEIGYFSEFYSINAIK